VATVVDAPAVTVDTASLARGAKTLTIRGTGFDPANLTNKVRLSGGATGVVTAATATTLTVAVRNLPAAGPQLKATVTSFGGTSGAAVTVAKIVRNPTVQSSTDQMPLSSKTITIRGSGFDPRFRNNLVTFNLGAVGYVTSATKNTLVVKFTTPPSVGRLKAVVTSFGGKSGMPVTVATIVRKATVTPSTQHIKRSDTTIQIVGTGFDTVAGNNTVTFNRGAEGYVTSATRNMLVVQLTTPPTAGRLKATVMAFGGSSGATVQVATATAAPTVDENDGEIPANQPSIAIYGSGFSTTASDNKVSFSTQGEDFNFSGTVTKSDGDCLTVVFDTEPDANYYLQAVVTTNGVSSGTPQTVAKVVTQGAVPFYNESC
jgi:RNase P/RNase MRP subunit p29